jgi:hypothetical protein
MVSRRIKSSVSHQSYVKVQCETRFPMIQFPAFLSMTWAFGNGRIVVPRAEMGTGIESVLCDLRVLRGKKKMPGRSATEFTGDAEFVLRQDCIGRNTQSQERFHPADALHGGHAPGHGTAGLPRSRIDLEPQAQATGFGSLARPKRRPLAAYIRISLRSAAHTAASFTRHGPCRIN